MSVTREEVDVHYCDICNARQTRMRGITQCQRCRRDVCPDHMHLVGGDYISLTRGRWFAHLCTDCRKEFSEELDPILAKFRPAESAPPFSEPPSPRAAESRGEPT